MAGKFYKGQHHMVFQTYNPRSSDIWTDERIILLLKLDAENILSRAQIANELARETGSCFSRNAIIGKLARLGVPPKDRPKAMQRHAQSRPKSIRPQPAPRPLPPSREAPQESMRLTLEQLTETTCHYPTNSETESFAFCGHPVNRGSYCAAHYQICYYAPRDPRPDQAHRIRVINARRYREALLKPACEAA